MIYYEKEEAIKIKNNKIDIITIIHTIHHIEKEKLKYRIKDIIRILKKEGIFIIVEHNIITKEDAILADIEHGIYEITINKNINFYKEHKTNYMN